MEIDASENTDKSEYFKELRNPSPIIAEIIKRNAGSTTEYPAIKNLSNISEINVNIYTSNHKINVSFYKIHCYYIKK